tara:strand:- start:297 stop:548 length:252 start_codon:yes stop_codon:yes gene_type:complete
MNKLLLNNKPKDITNEEFTKIWNNSSYVLESLYKTLVDIDKELNNVKKDDFDCPNHYAKLAYNAGQSRMIELVTSLLPKATKM